MNPSESKAAGTRIVALSGQSEDANARHARALGTTGFAAKSTDPDRLRQLIRRVLVSSDTSAAMTDSLIGTSLPLQSPRMQLRQFARSPFPSQAAGPREIGAELDTTGTSAQTGVSPAPIFADRADLVTLALRERHNHPDFNFDATLQSRKEAYIEAARQVARLPSINRTALYNRIDILGCARRPSFQ